MKLETKLKGVIIPLITPYAQGTLDAESLKNLAGRAIDEEVDGLLILGTTGEFQRLSFEEKKLVIDTIISLNRKKIKVIANVTSCCLEGSIELTRYAESKGIDAVVLAPQYQQEMSSKDCIQEFIIETMKPNWEESIPVILYNNPDITKGRNIPYEQICQLSELPGIIGIKDSSSDLGYFLKLFNLKSPSFSVLLGSEMLLKDNPFLSIDGFVSGTGNIEPDLVKRFFAGRKGKDLERMSKYLDEYSKFDSSIEGIKHIAYKQGIIRSAEMVKQK